MRPSMDKTVPSSWQAAEALASAVSADAEARGLSRAEIELINVRASQLNGCAFCLDLHARRARQAGVPQQQLDLLPAWRETSLFDDRATAVLAVAEAGTRMPLTDDYEADLVAARSILGDEAFTAAEWVATAINMFNRISILSEHPVRERKENPA